jgi:hypothetical protein
LPTNPNDEPAMRVNRMTIRRWMIVVVIAGVSLEAAGLWSLHRRYKSLASSFAGYQRHCQAILSTDPTEVEWARWSWDADPEWNRMLLGYSTRMRARFEYAAAHPRASTSPDPPAK